MKAMSAYYQQSNDRSKMEVRAKTKLQFYNSVVVIIMLFGTKSLPLDTNTKYLRRVAGKTRREMKGFGVKLT